MASNITRVVEKAVKFAEKEAADVIGEYLDEDLKSTAPIKTGRMRKSFRSKARRGVLILRGIYYFIPRNYGRFRQRLFVESSLKRAIDRFNRSGRRP